MPATLRAWGPPGCTHRHPDASCIEESDAFVKSQAGLRGAARACSILAQGSGNGRNSSPQADGPARHRAVHRLQPAAACPHPGGHAHPAVAGTPVQERAEQVPCGSHIGRSGRRAHRGAAVRRLLQARGVSADLRHLASGRRAVRSARLGARALRDLRADGPGDPEEAARVADLPCRADRAGGRAGGVPGDLRRARVLPALRDDGRLAAGLDAMAGGLRPGLAGSRDGPGRRAGGPGGLLRVGPAATDCTGGARARDPADPDDRAPVDPLPGCPARAPAEHTADGGDSPRPGARDGRRVDGVGSAAVHPCLRAQPRQGGPAARREPARHRRVPPWRSRW